MKTRSIFGILALAALSLTGCQSLIQDITPDRLEANPSGIYTFRMEVNLPTSYVEGSLKPQIVINGERHMMQQSETLGKDVYEFEYRVPASVSDVNYFYIVEYDYLQDGKRQHAERWSTDARKGNVAEKLYKARITNRYVTQIGTDRSPVGVEVNVMGAGFSEMDKVKVGGQEADTRFVSSTTLAFIVPSLDAGKSYDVQVTTGEGEIYAGKLRIDPSALHAEPSSLTLGRGEKTQLTFYIEGRAPVGGLYLTVETDIPASVIMPEVTIPEGARSVSVRVEGGDAGSGQLWIEAPGYDPLTIPVTVK